MSLSYHNRNASFACRSPLMLSDRLLSLAEDADKAGCAATALRLLALAHSVFDEAAASPVTAPVCQGVRLEGQPLGFMGVPAAIFAHRQFQDSGSARRSAR